MLHRIALNKIKRQNQYFTVASADISKYNHNMSAGILLGDIKGEFERFEYRAMEAEESISKLQKLHVEYLKMRRMLGLGKCKLNQIL